MSDAPPRGAGGPGAGVHDAQLSAIYQELILDHYRRPRNRGPVESKDARSARRKNPLCGDEMTLAVAFGDDGRVAEARFLGQGCSISQASASMLTQAVRGKTRAEVEALLRRFRAMMHGDAGAAADESLGELRALSGVARFPTRIQCATLAWSALDEILKGE